MFNLKKLAAISLSAVLAFSCAACGDKSGGKTVASADDLKGAKIGVQLGTTGDTYVTDEYEKDGAVIERYNKGADAVQALKQGKIDCVVIDSEPAKAFLEKNSELKTLEESLTSEEYAICVSKDKKDLTEKINAALKELKEDGTLSKIVSNYIGDEIGKTPYTSPEGTNRDNGKLVMATNAAFEPYEYYEGDKVVGIDADMAQAVADKLGMELVIEDMEFDSIITAVQSGKADMGVAGMTVTEDRLKSIDFTDSYTTAAQVIIVKK